MINPVTDLANSVGSWAITNSSSIMNGPIGYIVYFTLWVSLVWVVVYAIKKWF